MFSVHVYNFPSPTRTKKGSGLFLKLLILKCRLCTAYACKISTEQSTPIFYKREPIPHLSPASIVNSADLHFTGISVYQYVVAFAFLLIVCKVQIHTANIMQLVFNRKIFFKKNFHFFPFNTFL